ncbi:MAG: helix-turn-helix transcriptional regulator, partial [Bacteroidaceae bacterium]|nr:helix-turn-helix transcriptional regulator [Bacteroidaceae bacterium]
MSVSKTRKKLVDVARELFARKGFDNTTMNDIAQASQKGRRTLYTYFRNKEELYNAVVECELDRLSETMDELANRNIAPERK